VSGPARPRAEIDFWDDVGEHFPSLKGAASTAYCFECERLLLERFVPDLRGLLVLKTDLWDEAKNTEILRWAAGRGARVLGVDVAFPIARQARAVLTGHAAQVVVADVRHLPFRPESVDVVYSMGTIEHFPDSDVAAREIHRVLRTGGRAVVGVPNRLDPFLRPLLVHVLGRLGVYAYGMEKSFTPGGLQRLLGDAGFHVTARSGILFMPGWLRMLDLWCHVRGLALARVTGWAVRPFAWLYRRLPAVRRHGYLVACLALKTARPEPGETPGRLPGGPAPLAVTPRGRSRGGRRGRQPLPTRGPGQATVERHERERPALARHGHRGRELHRIIPAQCVTLGQLPGEPDDRVAHIDQAEGWPFVVQGCHEAPLLRARDHLFADESSERGPGLGVADAGRGDGLRARNRGADVRGPILVDVELHQGARVQVENHPRSSITTSEARRPGRRGTTRWRVPGLPRPRSTRPRAASRSSTSWSGDRAAGTSRARGWRRRVPIVT
jgi:SAM-dependent methyltransferase